MTTINQGVYIANNSDGYWEATEEQKKAFKNFPIEAYSGMGSSYWYLGKDAKETVQGIKNKYKMIMKFDGTMFLKTRDGKYRHIFEIKKPPVY